MSIPQATDEAVMKHTSEEYMQDFIIQDPEDVDDDDCQVDDSMDIDSDSGNNFARIKMSENPDVLRNQRLNLPPGVLPSYGGSQLTKSGVNKVVNDNFIAKR